MVDPRFTAPFDVPIACICCCKGAASKQLCASTHTCTVPVAPTELTANKPGIDCSIASYASSDPSSSNRKSTPVSILKKRTLPPKRYSVSVDPANSYPELLVIPAMVYSLQDYLATKKGAGAPFLFGLKLLC